MNDEEERHSCTLKTANHSFQFHQLFWDLVHLRGFYSPQPPNRPIDLFLNDFAGLRVVKVGTVLRRCSVLSSESWRPSLSLMPDVFCWPSWVRVGRPCCCHPRPCPRQSHVMSSILISRAAFTSLRTLAYSGSSSHFTARKGSNSKSSSWP